MAILAQPDDRGHNMLRENHDPDRILNVFRIRSGIDHDPTVYDAILVFHRCDLRRYDRHRCCQNLTCEREPECMPPALFLMY